jgi:hypothetical protein
MSYVATIKRMSDGTSIDVHMDEPWSLMRYKHTDPSCDCWRASAFGDRGVPCGNARYRVKITLPDGSVPYNEIDGEDAAKCIQK